MYISQRYRRANHVGGVRKRLARMIVAALKEQGVEARCEGKDLWPALGYWRQIQQDVMSWEGYCEVESFGKWMKRSLGSWDRMSSCIKGLTIEGDGFGYEVSAIHELDPKQRFKLLASAKRQ